MFCDSDYHCNEFHCQMIMSSAASASCTDVLLYISGVTACEQNTTILSNLTFHYTAASRDLARIPVYMESQGLFNKAFKAEVQHVLSSLTDL